MQVRLNVPVILCGITYKKGDHELPPEATIGWFFDGLKKEGKLLILNDDKKVKKNVSIKEKKKSKKINKDIEVKSE